ncbi:hypothetical protein J7E25_10905 [Agromyces sp. ISL-38]|uniref:hypothetical protein n=1 Tax=Agromyces sp. ISL-38 TaxID=2819107 RepID=UPI001BEBC0DE|nr:hypothetical protein [Agromyces sp. ISL-38]MBT2499605.1 hypothetical protein [Agromyces sp. ISL-38]MBT2516246.1 hypothetical protein [Streptomyces sp. ISL-90]
MNDGLALTPARAKELIDELERRLAARGIHGSIRIAGGAAMVLRFPDDPEVRVTTDVDAAYEPRPEVDEVIAEMARDYGLPDRWMNGSSTPWNIVTDTGEMITVATAEELVGMKMAAGRAQDLADLRILAKHLNITRAEELVDIAYAIYGEDSPVLNDSRESYELFARDVLADRRRS